MSAAAIQCPDSTGNVGPSVSPLPSIDWTSRPSSEDTATSNLRLERPYLRARRRVRQRVDAGEPRNSYSSIPGYSFRTGSGPTGLTLPGGMQVGSSVTNRKQFFAVAAAAQARATALANYRMQAPYHGGGPMGQASVQGRLPYFNDTFFRPHYPFGVVGHKNGPVDRHSTPPPPPPHSMNGFPFPAPGFMHQHRHGFLPRPPFCIPDEFSIRPAPQFGQFSAGNGPMFPQHVQPRSTVHPASASMSSAHPDPESELEKTIEAESSEFSSDFEEYRRKSVSDFDHDPVRGPSEPSQPAASCSVTDGLSEESVMNSDPPLDGLDNVRDTSRSGEQLQDVVELETKDPSERCFASSSPQMSLSSPGGNGGGGGGGEGGGSTPASAQLQTAERPSNLGCDADVAHATSSCLPPDSSNGETRSTPQVANNETPPNSSFTNLISCGVDVTHLDKDRSYKESADVHHDRLHDEEVAVAVAASHQGRVKPFDISNNNNNNKVLTDTKDSPPILEHSKCFQHPTGPGHHQQQTVFLRELLHGKLALAAAVAQHRQRAPLLGIASPQPFPTAYTPNQFGGFIPTGPFAQPPLRRPSFPPVFRGHFPPHRFSTMEAALLAKSGDYSTAVRHNNNELKDMASFVSHLFKMRQEMALNMTMDGHSSASDREDGDNDLIMDDMHSKNNNNVDDDLEEEEELEAPIDLQTSSRRQQRSCSEDDGRNSSQSDVDLVGSEEPRSPSSDAGLSVSSSGKDASTKSARLEHIVNSMRASPNPNSQGNSAPTVNGCKKRKLYQPVQHEARLSSALSNTSDMRDSVVEDIDYKKRSRNDENADPDMNSQLRRDKISATDLTNPLLHSGLPPMAVPSNLSPALQVHYMEMARKFIQEQQDKMTKEAITKEILNALNKSTDMAERIAAISPELKGIADVVKSEIAAKLTGIIDSSVGKYLHATRQTQQHLQMAQQQHHHHHHQPRNNLPFGKSFPISEDILSSIPPPPALKQQGHTPSGRAPQVRDRSTPRVPGTAPMSMANPIIAPKVTTCLASTTSTTTSPFSMLPTLRPAPVSSDQKDRASPFGGSSPSQADRNSNNEDELDDAASLNAGEQDEALSLVVTPKKRRHKVTDTRITPRTMTRVLGGDSPVDLHKPYGGSASSLFGLGKIPSTSELLSSRAVPGLTSPHATLFPGMAPPAFLPTSVAIPNPSLADFAAFTSSFYSPPNPSVTSSGPVTSSTTAPVRDTGRKSLASPLSPEKRHRHRSSESPLALMSRAGANVDFAAQLREDRNKEVEEFAQSSLPYLSGFNMGEATSATLTPMHLRKAKLMFFWVRYPSSAILKMYFPDIKFNKNNTAQLVKWFSNFREFYYIQMEKYARQAISEGVKSDSELRVNEDSELYRVLNVHYNRNNHIEVPEHFLPVLNVTLREFFNSVQSGKDAESSWKKQIYKVIARYDEAIPEYFKTPEFLKQLE